MATLVRTVALSAALEAAVVREAAERQVSVAAVIRQTLSKVLLPSQPAAAPGD